MFISLNIAWWRDAVSLLFPEVCRACGIGLQKEEEVLCLLCEYSLPKTNFHLDPENPVAKQFWGLMDIKNAAAFYRFHKGSKVQNLIHRLKYKGDTDVGRKVGQLYGKALKQCPAFAGISLILPVPLHPRKQKIRGYNQSSFFARGLSESMHIPVREDILVRTAYTGTQTRKSRLARRENTDKVFAVQHPEAIQGQHILLVDDVLTTGATTEACATVLLECREVSVSIVCMAYAD